MSWLYQNEQTQPQHVRKVLHHNLFMHSNTHISFAVAVHVLQRKLDLWSVDDRRWRLATIKASGVKRLHLAQKGLYSHELLPHVALLDAANDPANSIPSIPTSINSRSRSRGSNSPSRSSSSFHCLSEAHNIEIFVVWLGRVRQQNSRIAAKRRCCRIEGIEGNREMTLWWLNDVSKEGSETLFPSCSKRASLNPTPNTLHTEPRHPTPYTLHPEARHIISQLFNKIEPRHGMRRKGNRKVRTARIKITENFPRVTHAPAFGQGGE